MRLIEPDAGQGAYSLVILATEARRQTGKRYRSKPPVSRVGNKAGFVPNVLRAWGLNRARWTNVWLNDLDPVCNMIHLLYASSELRDAVARRIWSFVPCSLCRPLEVSAALDGQLRPTPAFLDAGPNRDGCPECSGAGTGDARRLWERIRSEPVPTDVVEALAAGVWLQGICVSGKSVTVATGGWDIPGFRSIIDDKGVTRGITSHSIASRLESLPCGLASIANVTARALFLQSRSFQLKPVTITEGTWKGHGYAPEVDNYKRKPTSHPGGEDSPRWTVAERLEALPAGRWVEHGFSPEEERGSPSGAIHRPLTRVKLGARLDSLPGPGNVSLTITRQDAALCLPEGDASDCVVILDPDYKGKDGAEKLTGYAHSSSRADVLMLARAWSDHGALVLVHEACGLAAELGPGWTERSASVLRARGSTFWGGAGEREWLTSNRAPVWWPAVQGRLF